MSLLQILSKNKNCTYLCYGKVLICTDRKVGKFAGKIFFSIIWELELKLLAVVVNYWVIIHCLWANCKQTYHFMPVLWSPLQLPSKQCIITQTPLLELVYFLILKAPIQSAADGIH